MSIRYLVTVIFQSRIVWLIVAFIILGAVLDAFAPLCFDDLLLFGNNKKNKNNNCLQEGVDNSTLTIVSGLVATIWIWSLALHMWSIKCCYPPKLYVEDNTGNIRPSGLWGLGWMGLALLLDTLGRILNPSIQVGETVYWSLNAVAALCVAFTFYCLAYFAMRSIQKRLRVLCCGCCSRIGLTTGMVWIAAWLVFGSQIACAALLENPTFESKNTTTENVIMERTMDDDNTIGEENDILVSSRAAIHNNIFDHHGNRNLLGQRSTIDDDSIAQPVEGNHTCQAISYYGNFALGFAGFFCYLAIANILGRAIDRREQKLNTFDGEFLESWGLRSSFAVMAVPWISLTIGNMFPVWMKIIGRISDRYWLELWIKARGGIIHHFGLSLIALLVHNWISTLTYQTGESRGSKESFHDLSLGAFERQQEQQGKRKEELRRTLFHDLTFGLFEPLSVALQPPASLDKETPRTLDLQDQEELDQLQQMSIEVEDIEEKDTSPEAGTKGTSSPSKSDKEYIYRDELTDKEGEIHRSATSTQSETSFVDLDDGSGLRISVYDER